MPLCFMGYAFKALPFSQSPSHNKLYGLKVHTHPTPTWQNGACHFARLRFIANPMQHLERRTDATDAHPDHALFHTFLT